jgi:hypothetical protein
LANVSAAQSLRRSAIFDDKSQRIIFVVDDLLVLQQLYEAVVRDVFEGLHSAAKIEHGECNAAEADRKENDAAPIEIGFVTAGFILSLRVTIWLWHNGKKILTTEKGYHEQIGNAKWLRHVRSLNR